MISRPAGYPAGSDLFSSLLNRLTATEESMMTSRRPAICESPSLHSSQRFC